MRPIRQRLMTLAGNEPDYSYVAVQTPQSLASCRVNDMDAGVEMAQLRFPRFIQSATRALEFYRAKNEGRSDEEALVLAQVYALNLNAQGYTLSQLPGCAAYQFPFDWLPKDIEKYPRLKRTLAANAGNIRDLAWRNLWLNNKPSLFVDFLTCVLNLRNYGGWVSTPLSEWTAIAQAQQNGWVFQGPYGVQNVSSWVYDWKPQPESSDPSLQPLPERFAKPLEDSGLADWKLFADAMMSLGFMVLEAASVGMNDYPDYREEYQRLRNGKVINLWETAPRRLELMNGQRVPSMPGAGEVERRILFSQAEDLNGQPRYPDDFYVRCLQLYHPDPERAAMELPPLPPAVLSVLQAVTDTNLKRGEAADWRTGGGRGQNLDEWLSERVLIDYAPDACQAKAATSGVSVFLQPAEYKVEPVRDLVLERAESFEGKYGLAWTRVWAVLYGGLVAAAWRKGDDLAGLSQWAPGRVRDLLKRQSLAGIPGLAAFQPPAAVRQAIARLDLDPDYPADVFGLVVTTQNLALKQLGDTKRSEAYAKLAKNWVAQANAGNSSAELAKKAAWNTLMSLPIRLGVGMQAVLDWTFGELGISGMAGSDADREQQRRAINVISSWATTLPPYWQIEELIRDCGDGESFYREVMYFACSATKCWPSLSKYGSLEPQTLWVTYIDLLGSKETQISTAYREDVITPSAQILDKPAQALDDLKDAVLSCVDRPLSCLVGLEAKTPKEIEEFAGWAGFTAAIVPTGISLLAGMLGAWMLPTKHAAAFAAKWAAGSVVLPAVVYTGVYRSVKSSVTVKVKQQALDELVDRLNKRPINNRDAALLLMLYFKQIGRRLPSNDVVALTGLPQDRVERILASIPS